MATISITVPSDGTTIDASDVATPLNTIVSELNGSIDSDNIASGGVVPNNLTAGTGTSWAWQDWTPSYSNITVGNGTVVARYTQIGKTVHFYWKLTLGSSSSIGTAPTISLPVNQKNADEKINGIASYLDNGSAEYVGVPRNNTSDASTTRLAYTTTGAIYQNVTATAPFTFGNADRIEVVGTYEAA